MQGGYKGRAMDQYSLDDILNDTSDADMSDSAMGAAMDMDLDDILKESDSDDPEINMVIL